MSYHNTYNAQPSKKNDQDKVAEVVIAKNKKCVFKDISAGCAVQTDLVNQFMSGNTTQFLSNTQMWYTNPPNPQNIAGNRGCNFLGVVRNKHIGELASGIVVNGNNPNGVQMGPDWIAQKTSKVSYFNCVLNALDANNCCDGSADPEGPPLPPPLGFHYMPDGTLMSDAKHAELYSEKIINSFDSDFTDLHQGGGVRQFYINGTNGAEFFLEIKNEDDYYYNFETNTFQLLPAKLNGIIKKDNYSVNVVFPQVTDNDQYDIYLYAKPGTKHVSLDKSMFADKSVNYNSSIGSNSLLLRKVIYQILGVTVTLASTSPTATVALSGSTNDTLELGRYASKGKSFSLTARVASNAISVDRQPTENDMFAIAEPVVGSAPIHIFGEDIYPAITTAADSTSEGGTTVNGASTGTTVTTHVVSSTIATLGDRVLGNAELESKVATVTAISSGSGKTFTISEAISIADDLPLTFSNQMNYQWPVDNANKLSEEMVVIPGTNILASTTLAAYEDITTTLEGTINEKDIINTKKPAVDKTNSVPTVVNGLITVHAGNIVFNKQQALALAGNAIKVGGYGPDLINTLTGWDIQVSNLKLELNAVTTTTTADTSASASFYIAVASVVGIADTTSQTVNMAAGSDEIKKYTLTNNTTVLDSVDGLRVGQNVRAFGSGTLVGNPVITAVSELNKTITLSSSQTFVDGAAITFSNSDISGIGIDALVVDPYVTNISSLNLTSSVAQALESGQTLTFSGAGDIATITGDIIVKKAGPLDLALSFDVEKFLTYHS